MVYSGIRKVNELHPSWCKQLDARELATCSRLSLLATKNGLKPIRVKQGFNCHSPVVTMHDGSRWLGEQCGEGWKLIELEGTGSFQEPQYEGDNPEWDYSECEDDFDYSDDD